MDNALLIGLSRQMALSHQMSVVANNIANSGTAGYKSEELRFEEFIETVTVTNTDGTTSEDISFVIDYESIRDFRSGPLDATGNAFDIALNGEGWFVVETENGDRYTRDGHFTLDADGTLVNASGQPLLGESGTFVIGPDETGFAVAPDGTVSTSAGEKGRLQVVSFEGENLLQKEGENLFSSDEIPVIAENYRVAQGYVEQSNVEAVTETAQMIEVMRAYISTARMLEKLAELKTEAINQLGVVQA